MIGGKVLPLDANGNFSFTWGLEQGVNVLNILVVDSVGNQNTTVRRVVFDRVLPTMDLIVPEDGLFTNISSVVVRGITEADVNITAVNGLHSVDTVANKEGWFELEIELDEGGNTIVTTATDGAGNSVLETVKVERDSTPPNITLYNHYDGKVVDGTSYLLEGETEAGARLKINGELVTVGRTGKFSKELPLPSANNTIIIESVDRAGNREKVVTHIARKPHKTPKPKEPGLGPDYFPWAVLAAIIVMSVQGLVLSRHSQQQAIRARRRAEAEAAADEEDELDEIERSLDEEERARPRRPRRPTKRPEEGPGPVDDEGYEEDEFELEVYDRGGDDK
jgi:hypothetical protein